MAGLKEQVEGFVAREIILEPEAKAANLLGVSRFFTSALGKRVLHSTKIRREMAFSRMLQAKRFYPEVSDEKEQIFIQGIIDLLFDEADGMILVDYKTDRETDHELIVEKYKLQIELYSEAAAAILRRPIKERYIYLFHSGELVAM